MDKKIERSRALYEDARRYIPGGVNSPVRAYRAVGGDPLFIVQGKGAVIIDVDGNEYVDCSEDTITDNLKDHAREGVEIYKSIKEAVYGYIKRYF